MRLDLLGDAEGRQPERPVVAGDGAFGQADASQYAVRHWMMPPKIARRPARGGPPSPPQASDRDGWKQSREKVEAGHRRQASIRQHAQRLVQGVPPAMLEKLVMLAPQPRERGYGHDESRPRSSRFRVRA